MRTLTHANVVFVFLFDFSIGYAQLVVANVNTIMT